MIAVTGSMPALKLIDGRLQFFGLDRKCHFVRAVTDGVSMMNKLVTHSFSDLLYKVSKEVVEELAEELGEEEEEEEQEGDEEGETVAKALHGQRFPLLNY